MPPSGFSQTAINGLLRYVKECYEYAAKNAQEDESTFLVDFANTLRKRSASQAREALPGVSQEGVDGLVTFVTECFIDLVDEIHAGQDKYGRPVLNGAAIDKELAQIQQYLAEFTI